MNSISDTSRFATDLIWILEKILWSDVSRYDPRSFMEHIHDEIKMLLVSMKTIYFLHDVYQVNIWPHMVHINKTRDMHQKCPYSRENPKTIFGDSWSFRPVYCNEFRIHFVVHVYGNVYLNAFNLIFVKM